MRRTAAALAVALVAVPAAAAGGEFSGVLRAVPQMHELRDGSPFATAAPLTDFGRDRLRLEAEARAKFRAVTFVGTGRTTMLEGREPRHEGFVNELYSDTKLAGQALTVGKKIFGWGVGFGFRPLDVVQQQDRRLLNVFTFEGIPALAWERFTETSAWTLVAANPFRGRAGESRDDESLALRYFRQDGSTDWHAVARWSARYRVQAGVGWNLVASDSTQFYGSVLGLRRHEQRINPLAGTNDLFALSDPLRTERRGTAWQASAGGSWTGESGIGVLAEIWYDGTAYRESDWQAVRQLAAAQVALLPAGVLPEAAVRGNVAYSLRTFDRPNLMRENVLVRLSYDGEFWDVAIDALFTPRDSGAVLTATLSRQYDRLRWELGVRRFAGPPGSAYGMFPERTIAFASSQWFF